jgi:serine protease
LDRIDDRTGQDGTYGAPNDGKGIHVYVLDTGVRTTHEDYGGRAIPTLEAYSGTNKVCNAGDTSCANDANGHGTHCAGTVGGTKSGVAKGVTLHAVKVLSDQGSGSTAGIVNAIDWVMQNSPKPSVISMSLGGAGQSQAFKTAIDRAVAARVVAVVAGGNDNKDSCQYSPAFVPSAITVGSTAKGDGRSSFSNYGTCTDIFAPGSDINSAWHTGDGAYKAISGTSMACPHVAGAVALLLQQDKSLTPADVNTKLRTTSTKGAISNVGAGSPNMLLYLPPRS